MEEYDEICLKKKKKGFFLLHFYLLKEKNPCLLLLSATQVPKKSAINCEVFTWVDEKIWGRKNRMNL